MKSRVYIVETDATERDSLATFVHSQGFELAAFATPESFRQDFEPRRPGCVLIDLQNDGTGGEELQRQMVTDGNLTPFIFFTGIADVRTTVRVMRNGALTVLQKPYDLDDLITAIREALTLDEERIRQEVWKREVADRLNHLTVGEVQVMNLMLDGKPNKTIAQSLDVSMRTIDRRRRSVLNKMGIDSVPELAQLITAYRREEEIFRSDLDE